MNADERAGGSESSKGAAVRVSSGAGSPVAGVVSGFAGVGVQTGGSRVGACAVEPSERLPHAASMVRRPIRRISLDEPGMLLKGRAYCSNLDFLISVWVLF
jgi:hypothetical protein